MSVAQPNQYPRVTRNIGSAGTPGSYSYHRAVETDPTTSFQQRYIPTNSSIGPPATERSLPQTGQPPNLNPQTSLQFAPREDFH
jgi:hypothetical protein